MPTSHFRPSMWRLRDHASPLAELPPHPSSPQAGILKAGAVGIECSLKAKHTLAQVVMGAAAAQRFTPLDSL